MAMQPQGLGALMPQVQQGQPPVAQRPMSQPPVAQPPVDPARLQAATRVVSSDAEEQIFDPKLLAMLKYNDAIEAVKAADQALAAQYQPPQPENLFERKQMSAAEGIAGLAKKLAPGVQNRARQMSMPQNPQPMGGPTGLPGLPAPNIAGMKQMARGGIVGLAEGGQPSTSKFVGPMREMLDENVTRYLAIEAAAKRYEAAGDMQSAARERQNLNSFPPETKFKVARMLTLMQGGNPDAEYRIGGAVKKYAGPEGSEVESDEDTLDGYRRLQVENQNPIGRAAATPGVDTSPPTGRAAQEIEAARRRNAREAQRFAEFMSRGDLPPPALFLNDTKIRQALASEGVLTEEQKNTLRKLISEPAPAPAPTTATTPTPTPTRLDPNRIPSRTATPDIRNSGILESLLSRAAPAAPAAGGTDTMGSMRGQLNKLIDLIGAPTETTTPQIDSRLEALRDPMIDAVTRFMDPEYAENQRSRIQQEAAAAYALPQEYRDLVNAERERLNTPLYTPEEARSRKIDALLAGLASSNLIAQSGPRAAAMVNQVSDAIKQDSLNRADKQFALASGLMETDRSAAIESFNAGLGAMGTAQNQATVAVQMTGSMLNSADQTAAAAALQARQEKLAQITAIIQALTTVATLEKGDAAQLVDIQRNLTSMYSDVAGEISDLNSQLFVLANDPTAKALTQSRISALQLQLKNLETQLNAVGTKLGFPTQPTPDSGDQLGGVGAVDAADYFK